MRVLKIKYTKKALKGLRKMPMTVAQQFVRNFEQLAGGSERGLDLKSLQGRGGIRMRVREWRAIYQIDGEQLIILVLDAGPRGGIYK